MSSRELLHGSALGLTMLGLAACVLTGCTTQQQQPTPIAAGDQTSTEGTATFTGGAVALGIGFQWGSGTLTFRGREYPFSVRGLSVADVGVSRVTATGTVQNLRNVADFSGNYIAVSAGGAVAGGGSVGALRNQNGVVINGITTQQGLRLTLAASGLSITLTPQ
jgi:hypothetical protein